MRRAAAVGLSVLMICCAICAPAQRTTRSGRPRAVHAVAERVALPVADTVVAPAGALTVAGYDKTLSSRRESFFVSNHMDSATVVWIGATIDYLDTGGNQLHRRHTGMRCDIPPGQTRRIDIPAWDRQGVYYYRGSEPGRRVQAAASPFDIRFSVDSIALAR
ncbi:MAG: hypothetical protein K2M12_05265 [Muribaculaceae bacterium]|nr:hypothetical protein [Muribaculaceae bacterium]